MKIGQSVQIGEYKITRIDQDYYEVFVEYSTGGGITATVCGGDFETALSTLFIGAEIKRKRY